MLKLMRRFANSWFGKILGVALIIALASFGVPTILATLDANNITHVGDEDVSTVDFQRLYQQNLQAFAQQTGQMPTNEQALQYGIPAQVLNTLTTRAAINSFAKRHGVGVSDTKLAELVRNDPTFFGILGTFDRSVYDQTIAQQGLTTEQYFETQRRAARRQQIALGMLAGSYIPTAASEILNRYRNDLRSIDYFTLNATSVPAPAEPTDEELTAYLTENQTQYRTLETRAADVLAFSPASLAALPAYQPAEDAVLAEYERTKDTLTTIERRTIKQVVLADAAAEKIFTDQQAAGADFDTALAASGLTALELGNLARTEVADPALAAAAFGLAKAGDFTIIAGVGSRRVVAVTAIEAGGQIPYETAKSGIATRLATEKARTAYADILDQIEELRAAFQPLSDIAARFGLSVTTLNLTPGGPELSTVPNLAEENRARAAQAIFAGEAGKLAPSVTFGANSNFWFDLKSVEPARDQTLNEVRTALRDAWTNKKIDEALKAEVAAITAELDGGKAIAEAASSRGLFPSLAGPFTRDGSNTAGVDPAVATAVFAVGPDGHGSAVNADGDYVVFHVTDVTAPTTAADQDTVNFVTQGTQDTLYADFIVGLTDEMWPVSARNAAYQRMINLLLTGTQ